MKPETARFIDYGLDLLDRARRMLAMGLYDDAGRSAYLACFHVAQAVIFELDGRVMKTHRGVQGEFYRLVYRDPRVSAELAAFLPRAYKFKSAADYGIEPAAHASPEEIQAGVAEAARFVATFAAFIGTPEASETGPEG